jgi:hypothetical protein
VYGQSEAFSPDGRRVVTVDWTGKQRLRAVPPHVANELSR